MFTIDRVSIIKGMSHFLANSALPAPCHYCLNHHNPPPFWSTASYDSPTSLSSNSHNWKVRRVSRKRHESEDDPRKKIPCDYEGCRKKFTTIYNKKHHVEAVHLGIKHQCHLCSSSFSQVSSREMVIRALYSGPVCFCKLNTILLSRCLNFKVYLVSTPTSHSIRIVCLFPPGT